VFAGIIGGKPSASTAPGRPDTQKLEVLFPTGIQVDLDFASLTTNIYEVGQRDPWGT
jgi:hypothetical protein